MNFGYADIQDVIYKNAIRMKYPGAAKFAKDTAKLIWELFEEGGDVSKKEYDLAYGFPQDLNPIVSQLERGLGILMMRDENAIEVYKWLKEQGKDKINAFIKWATDKERVQFVGKYRRSPRLIINEWKLVFDNEAPAIIRNEDGSLNV